VATEVYFKEQIKNGLVSTLTAILSTGAANGLDMGFARGVLVVIKSQADLYGLSWPAILDQVGRSAVLSQDLARLLEGA
jgi:hypothetical protein